MHTHPHLESGVCICICTLALVERWRNMPGEIVILKTMIRERSVDDFNAAHPDFEPIIWDSIRFQERTVEKASQVIVWPQDLTGNGMFIAGWRRK